MSRTKVPYLIIAALAFAMALGIGLLLTAHGAASERPAPQPTGAQMAASRVAQCRADLQAVHDLWVRDPSFSYDPPSCDQPGVSFADYSRAFAAVGGGPAWVAVTS